MSSSFIICSMFYSALLLIVFYSKRRLNTLENKVYSKLIMINFISLILEFFCYLITLNQEEFPILTSIINKTYLVFLLTWLTLFAYYTFLVSFKKRINLRFNNKELYKKIRGIFTKIYLIAAFALLVLPLYYNNADLNSVYSYGPGSLLCTIMSSICILASLLFMLIGHKNIQRNKFIPLIGYIIMFPIVIYIQYKHPELLLTTPVETFITFLLYFTIENPDLKIIDELSDAKQRAEEANRAKTKFLYEISHEIRTPLTTIIGFTDSLSDRKLDKEAKNDLANISSSVTNLLQVVNGILDISKLDSKKINIVKKRYDLSAMLEELVDFSKEVMAKNKVELRTCFDTTLPEALYGDYVILRQILLNLLANSIERTKIGYIEFNVTSVNKNNICRLIISLEDTGGTIKKEKLEKIFIDKENSNIEEDLLEGVTSSLVTTKKLVDLMDGTIVAQNVYGRGCKYTVSIDQEIVYMTKNTILENKETEEIKDIGDKRILIVDDNKLNIKVAERLLKSYNVEVEYVLSGADCIEKITSGEYYDLILMDDMMPNMSGVETYKKLKQNSNFHTPTVMLTANAIDGMKEKYLLQDGFDEYIAKPIEKKELDRVIKKIFK